MKTLNTSDLKKLHKPKSDSHKGENGRLMVIGGSKLFHASIYWSADVASRIVDLVHFSSPAEENNDLIRLKLKEGFWNGIVVPYKKINEYIEEDDCVLVGPGMPREEGLMEGEIPTKDIVNSLLAKYPQKRWVIDGGALQEVDPKLLNNNMIITPHRREWEMLAGELPSTDDEIEEKLVSFSSSHSGVTVLLKGEKDYICSQEEVFSVGGGNSGMTKGGTGDVLAGLVAALYCKNEVLTAASVGSYVNKKAGEKLAKEVGSYFNASDLVEAVSGVLVGL